MLNDTDLAYLEEVEARYNESTPGQWTLPLYGYTIETAEKKLFFAFGMGEPAFADMRFVCAAHTDIPRLIAMVRAGDQPEVVHCVDCFYGAAETKQDGYLDPPRCDGVYCFRFSHDMDFTDYCSCGKPKDGQRAGEGARNE